jgi:hypothetical protein
MAEIWKESRSASLKPLRRSGSKNVESTTYGKKTATGSGFPRPNRPATVKARVAPKTADPARPAGRQGAKRRAGIATPIVGLGVVIETTIGTPRAL